jgi:hypothetical protein
MTEMMTIIEWWVVPILLFCLLLYLLVYVPSENSPALIQTSSRSGKAAAFVVLALFIVSRKPSADVFSFQIPVYQFDYFSTIVATILGLIVCLAFGTLKTTRYLGVLSFILTSAVSITIYSYFYISDIRGTVVFWTLGITLGILFKRMIFPTLDPMEADMVKAPSTDQKPS